ncbi:MAG: putative quinol monooxygenase [Caulobacteraceae bacterium]
MIVVQGWVRVHADNLDALRNAAAELAAETRREDGNLAYAFAADINDPGLLQIVERWASEEAVAAHMLSPSLAAFMPKLASMREVSLRIARYDAPEERVLTELAATP